MHENELFEEWYCKNYWDFNHPSSKPVVKFNAGSYNHNDVDLAWNSWLAGKNSVKHEENQKPINHDSKIWFSVDDFSITISYDKSEQIEDEYEWISKKLIAALDNVKEMSGGQ